MFNVYNVNTMRTFGYFENRDDAENALKQYAEGLNGQYEFNFDLYAYCITFTDNDGNICHEWFNAIVC